MEVFGAAGGERDLVYVRLPNSTTRGLPAWMFDELICAKIRSADQPIIDFDALLKLVDLLDLARSHRRSAGHEATTALPQKAAAPAAEPAIPAATEHHQSKRVHPKHSPEQVPATLPGVAAVGRSHRSTSKRRAQ